MEETISVKEKLQVLNYRVYSVHQLEPKSQDLFGGSLVCKEHTVEFIYLDTDKITTVLKLNYADIVSVHVDNILIDIKMKNGVIYHLYELRQDLNKILEDFKGLYFAIEDEETIHVLQNYKIDRQYNILNITGTEIDEYSISKPFRYTIDLNIIDNICEDYWGEEVFREVFISFKDGRQLAIWTE